MKIDIIKYFDYAQTGILFPIILILLIIVGIIVAPFALAGFIFEKIFKVSVNIE